MRKEKSEVKQKESTEPSGVESTSQNEILVNNEEKR